MRIGLVGGLDRNEGAYADLARRAGYRFEHHNRHLAGRGGAALDALVDRCDVVVVVTDVNSHGAAWRARRLARQRGSVCLVMSRCGPSKFVELLGELSRSSAPGAGSVPPPRAAVARA
jgi:hypothetical protein